ncbi:UNVERIFIED_CONTAM: hypothetical protein ABID98_003176 [Brevibacillus sp. OAP136]
MILKFFKWVLAIFLIIAVPYVIYTQYVNHHKIPWTGIGFLVFINSLLFRWDEKRAAKKAVKTQG